jgi:two-component system chemotaxis response regulator CheB
MTDSFPDVAPSPQRLVVVGASAGGVAALRQLAGGLPADFPAPVLIVLHVGAHESILPELIRANCALDVAHAVDREPLLAGTIRIAPPDHHLDVIDGHLRLSRGPKENYARPAIDPLFRTAALEFGPRAIGVILTGMLDDGTTGLQAIKEAGGVAVVQHPDDALEPSMPTSALRHVDVDHCVPLAAMPALLSRLAATPAETRSPAMSDRRRRLKHEQGLSLGTGDFLEHLKAIAEPSPLTCPDCHGGLWQVRDSSPRRYRCHTGHAFTARTLDLAVAEETDAAMWNALRALHERATVLGQLAELSRIEQQAEDVTRLEEAARRVVRQGRLLRQMMEHSPDSRE